MFLCLSLLSGIFAFTDDGGVSILDDLVVVSPERVDVGHGLVRVAEPDRVMVGGRHGIVIRGERVWIAGIELPTGRP